MDAIGEAETDYIKAKLQSFFARNTEAYIKSGERQISVIGPWGEEGIEIPLNNEDEELFEALNAVRLPPRFTAIWHEDRREFEVIFTVLNRQNRLLDREFEFRFRGKCYRCSFGSSSSRLRGCLKRASVERSINVC